MWFFYTVQMFESFPNWLLLFYEHNNWTFLRLFLVFSLVRGVIQSVVQLNALLNGEPNLVIWIVQNAVFFEIEKKEFSL